MQLHYMEIKLQHMMDKILIVIYFLFNLYHKKGKYLKI